MKVGSVFLILFFFSLSSRSLAFFITRTHSQHTVHTTHSLGRAFYPKMGFHTLPGLGNMVFLRGDEGMVLSIQGTKNHLTIIS